LNLSVYVVRTTDGKNIKDSAPCIDCFTKMKQLGIKNIIYSSEDNKIIKRRVVNYKPKTISLGRLFLMKNCEKKITREQLKVFRENELHKYYST
jgi:hypothetical protein